MICTGSDPKSIGVGGVEKNAGSSDNFQYKTMTCTDPTGSGSGGATYTKITEPTPGTRTYDFSNSLTLGDVMVSGFMVMFMFFAIAWGVYLLTFRRKY